MTAAGARTIYPFTPASLTALDSNLNARFRGLDGHDWNEWFEIQCDNASTVPPGAERAWLNRKKASHKGIRERLSLTHLIAGAADQSYLAEIGTLVNLERLELEHPVTAHDLSPLHALKKLKHLRLVSPRRITDFKPLLELSSLKTLFIENLGHMTEIDWLRGADHIEVLGIEGSIWKPHVIPSLAPLSGLKSLKAFFATSVRLKDQDLSALGSCPRLEYLSCARFAPRASFERLHALNSRLVCRWFGPEGWDDANLLRD
ncbi:hypothetical protein [Brevundimonas sp.]|uniref:hypothetical protein n=1 Tax=Brevundimonas sp. TaxID=1871086 RepID=UPI00391BFC54